jgi:hypothetical protein
MKNELNLVKKKAWAINSSDSEVSSSIKGYYKDSSLAHIESNGCGWFGSDGEVICVTVYEDEEGKVYSVEDLGKYRDDEEVVKEKIINSIKEKLTTDELVFLGIKQ